MLGYGAKAFTISMVETALQISNGKIAADIIRQIVDLGKSLLKMPIELLPGVKETLKTLKETGKYKLVVATKGDLLDQETILLFVLFSGKEVPLHQFPKLRFSAHVPPASGLTLRSNSPRVQ